MIEKRAPNKVGKKNNFVTLQRKLFKTGMKKGMDEEPKPGNSCLFWRKGLKK